MLARVWSAAVFGVQGYRVSVEADVSHGFPRFLVVGLPGTAIRESRERVISAIRNSGVDIPFERVVVNLAPADIRKEGAGFDLPMAVAVAAAAETLPLDSVTDVAFVGELSLDGHVRPVRGILPMILALRQAGQRTIVIPESNLAEASVVEGLRLHGIDHLSDVFDPDTWSHPSPVRVRGNGSGPEGADFRDVRGQEAALRAMEIAAAGGHHVAMSGPPGVGKTMIARRLPGILPPLSPEAALEPSRIHSVAGLLGRERPLLANRPFRAPHHTTTLAGLLGGSWPPRPGEVSLAHCGVLFLDEFPEMRREVLEGLREPLEDGVVRLVRGGYRVVFPSRFQLAVAMNPCPCGFLGHPLKPCTCTPVAIRRYHARVSGPLLDRIDLVVSLAPVRFRELVEGPRASTRAIRDRVLTARARAARRQGACVNAQLPIATLRRISPLTRGAGALVERAVEELGFSARAHDRALRVGRTIADLRGGGDRITETDMAEAMQYRGAVR